LHLIPFLAASVVSASRWTLRLCRWIAKPDLRCHALL
jgi:hypothetical protein